MPYILRSAVFWWGLLSAGSLGPDQSRRLYYFHSATYKGRRHSTANGPRLQPPRCSSVPTGHRFPRSNHAKNNKDQQQQEQEQPQQQEQKQENQQEQQQKQQQQQGQQHQQPQQTTTKTTTNHKDK